MKHKKSYEKKFWIFIFHKIRIRWRSRTHNISWNFVEKHQYLKLELSNCVTSDSYGEGTLQINIINSVSKQRNPDFYHEHGWIKKIVIFFRVLKSENLYTAQVKTIYKINCFERHSVNEMQCRQQYYSVYYAEGSQPRWLFPLPQRQLESQIHNNIHQ